MWEKQAMITFENNNILVKTINKRKNIKKNISQFCPPSINCLESETVNKIIRHLDYSKGLVTSSSSSAKIYQALSKGVYLYLKDILERVNQLSNHHADTIKQKQAKKNISCINEWKIDMEKSESKLIKKENHSILNKIETKPEYFNIAN